MLWPGPVLLTTRDYKVLNRLKHARRAFDAPILGGSPRKPSIYEREWEIPCLQAPPLPQPCPHVFDSAPMRSVSVAIHEGVGILLGGTSPSAGRGSVFGKFW
jgi:sorting nexin-9/18/33